MNNFSELQATDLSLTLLIELTPHYHTHAPEVAVNIGGAEWYAGALNNHIQLAGQLPLLSQFDIEIHLQNKNDYADCTTAAVITQLALDNHQLIPNWTHLSQYSNDRGYQQPTTHLGFNGIWKLSIDKPFYQWWHINTGQGRLLEPG
jgi:hypothetical protein